MISVDTSQVEALAAALGVAAAKTIPAATAAVAETANDAAETARGLAPVDTGALRGSIDVTVSGLSAEVGSDIRYAGYVEYGTSDTAPQPFMGPAADQAEPAFIEALMKATGDLL